MPPQGGPISPKPMSSFPIPFVASASAFASAMRRRCLSGHAAPVVLALAVIAALASCSTVERTVRRAEAAEAIGEYAEAAALFRQAYQRTSPKDRAARGRLAYSMAECYRRYGQVARAAGGYQNAERYGLTDTLTLLRLGDMLRAQGNYRAAAAAYQRYLDTHPADPAALAGIEAAAAAPEITKKGSPYTVTSEKVLISTRSDFCPAFADDKTLVFTTTRNTATGNDLSGVTAMKYADIFCVKRDEKGRWKTPEPLEGDVNTEFEEGACQFSPDGKTMYLTVCRRDATYPRMAEIYTSARQDAKWAKPQPLKVTADTLSSYAHPAVSPDGRWLYFTSDMPGGQGGFDLWRASLGSHGLGAVENLGPDINTPGNEVFPAFRPNGELYFSSDGRLPNLGGLDLYRAREDTVTQRWTVSALPAPMNSAGDDFGITFDGLHHRGYFSSSRAGRGVGRDRIYAFSHPEVLLTVKGWVYEQDGYELPEATVYVVGDDGSYIKRGVQSDGSFEEALSPGVRYVLLATCKGFLNVTQTLVADTAEVERQYVLQFPLPSLSVPVLVRGINYAFDSAELTPDSRTALDRLGRLLTENPHVTIELAAHCDNRGSDAYNDRLSQRRAESVVRYLTDSCHIAADRLTAVGYGERRPQVVTRRMAEQHAFLKEGDTLTVAFIDTLRTDEEREACHALNRRTAFRVLRTTYGLFDENGRLRPDAFKRPDEDLNRSDEDEEEGADAR